MVSCRSQWIRACALLAVACLCVRAAIAQSTEADPAAIIRACDVDASRCDPATLPHDRAITLSGGVASQQNYEWLREGIKALKGANAADRHKRAELLLRHLEENNPGGSTVPQARARREADSVLANVEFAKAKPSWLQQQWDRLQQWLNDHTRIPGHTTRSWIRFLLETLLFAVPLLLLVLWLLRQIREDRLRPAEATAREQKTARHRTDWVQQARAYAAERAWREAVHALYWHSIGALEEQRVFAPSRTRTPREYLDLLQPGSKRRTRLRELTMLLEVVWYGYREPDESDYLRAQALAQEVAAA